MSVCDASPDLTDDAPIPPGFGLSLTVGWR